MSYVSSTLYTTRNIINRLQGDTALIALVGPTILNRPPKREGRWTTPTAYDADFRIRPTAYVPESTQGPGRNVFQVPLAYRDTVSVYFMGPSDEERKDILRAAKHRVRLLLTLMSPDTPSSTEPWYFTNDDGRKMWPQRLVTDSGFQTSEALKGESAVESFLLFTFDGLRAR